MNFKLWLEDLNQNVSYFIDYFKNLGKPNPLSNHEYYIIENETIIKYTLSKSIDPNTVYFDSLVVIPQQTGAGTSFMNKIIQKADELKVDISLHAIPLPTQKKISKINLYKFYRKFGFKGTEYMIRKHNKS
jgi:GNAT superfamily N-acetyltransferase